MGALRRVDDVGDVVRRASVPAIAAVAVAVALMLCAVAAPASAALSFSGPTSFAAGMTPEQVVVGNFDADSVPDLAVADYGTPFDASAAGVSILRGDGNGGFTGPTRFAVGVDALSVAVGDFNEDSESDLALSNSSRRSVSILLGDGAGGFDGPTGFAVGEPVSVAVGDFNADAHQDLAVAKRPGSVSILLGDGAGGFTGPADFGAGGGVSVAVGDFNADSQPDLAVGNIDSRNVSILLGDGSGGFTGPANFAMGGDSQPQSVAVGDFNADSRPDVAVANYSSSYADNVSILLGDGAGGFIGPTQFSVGRDPTSLAVGDFDADSNADLAVAIGVTHNVSILRGNGSGGFSAPTDFAVGTASGSVAAADLNGDSRPDLALGNPGWENVSIMLNTTPWPGYGRPKGATPLYTPLVIAYKACTSPNRTHAPPLAGDSCAWPAQSSAYLTTGTPDANGAADNMVGSVRYKVIAGNPATTADEADVELSVSVTDVRRRDDLGDYTGELQVNAPLQITDRLNGAANRPGTVQEVAFPMTVGCSATADTSVGSTCSLATTLDAVTPGAVPEGARSIWQMGAVEVADGGADGLASTAGNTVFVAQGIFVP